MNSDIIALYLELRVNLQVTLTQKDMLSGKRSAGLVDFTPFFCG